jgi:Zn ribbon nucleic-acid-binding protein
MDTARRLAFVTIIDLVADGYGHIDAVCPECGPSRRSPVNQRRKTLRIWREDSDFATYHCARCGMKGYAHRDGVSSAIDLVRMVRLRADASARSAAHEKEQHRKANRLWSASLPAQGTIIETYLIARGINCAIPPTLRFLAQRKPEYHPAMIAAFAMPDEPEPGLLRIDDDAVGAVHLTFLKPDGSAKANTETTKIVVGSPHGLPIVLAPANDLGGLIACEGIEDGLSAHEATGLGVWAAGSASRLPAIAGLLPAYVACLTVIVDDDATGRAHAAKLTDGARARGFYVETLANLEMRIAA